MKKLLFIDRDGTIIKEAPPTYQIDSWDKLEFYPGAISGLRRIAEDLDFELVMVTNQDGLGSPSFNEESFWPIQNFILKTLENENIRFNKICIDRSFAKDNHPDRKPGTGMLKEYLNKEKFDLEGSFVIGDRVTDVQLSKNLGCKAIWIKGDISLGQDEIKDNLSELESTVVLETTDWKEIFSFLKLGNRIIQHSRDTNETRIIIDLNLDGKGKANINTGLHFFDHMLDQLARHSGMDLSITVKGDLQVDEHHTIEDTGIALGEAIGKALADKKGIERYGFSLPMDDSLAQVALDFGGRSWLVWDASFNREKIGDMPTEMFSHFFKSFCDGARCNLNIKSAGENEHHKIESIFKALARSIKMAIKRDVDNVSIPTTKGIL